MRPVCQTCGAPAVGHQCGPRMGYPLAPIEIDVVLHESAKRADAGARERRRLFGMNERIAGLRLR